MAGAFFYYFLDFFEKKLNYFLILSILILITNKFYELPFFEPFALAVVIIFFGLFLHLGNIRKYGDFSYGVYILHFPIIQIFLQQGWLEEQPFYFLISVIFMTLIGAVILWHQIEKRFLLRSSHYLAK